MSHGRTAARAGAVAATMGGLVLVWGVLDSGIAAATDCCDGICEAGETCSNCPCDCGTPDGVCGSFPFDECLTCPDDCVGVCGGTDAAPAGTDATLAGTDAAAGGSDAAAGAGTDAAAGPGTDAATGPGTDGAPASTDAAGGKDGGGGTGRGCCTSQVGAGHGADPRAPGAVLALLQVAALARRRARTATPYYGRVC
ncbi:MAG TPA: hypothetical protein VG389_29535 [Myxococcota bacterium]|jgi:hypothetical protein|nr:hypothetical protein [Myxococcota bacterium]